MGMRAFVWWPWELSGLQLKKTNANRQNTSKSRKHLQFDNTRAAYRQDNTTHYRKALQIQTTTTEAFPEDTLVQNTARTCLLLLWFVTHEVIETGSVCHLFNVADWLLLLLYSAHPQRVTTAGTSQDHAKWRYRILSSTLEKLHLVFFCISRYLSTACPLNGPFILNTSDQLYFHPDVIPLQTQFASKIKQNYVAQWATVTSFEKLPHIFVNGFIVFNISSQLYFHLSLLPWYTQPSVFFFNYALCPNTWLYNPTVKTSHSIPIIYYIAFI